MVSLFLPYMVRHTRLFKKPRIPLVSWPGRDTSRELNHLWILSWCHMDYISFRSFRLVLWHRADIPWWVFGYCPLSSYLSFLKSVDSIKDVVRSSVKVPEFDKHLKKAGGHIGQNVVEMAIKMKTTVRKLPTSYQQFYDKEWTFSKAWIIKRTKKSIFFFFFFFFFK